MTVRSKNNNNRGTTVKTSVEDFSSSSVPEQALKRKLDELYYEDHKNERTLAFSPSSSLRRRGSSNNKSITTITTANYKNLRQEYTNNNKPSTPQATSHQQHNEVIEILSSSSPSSEGAGQHHSMFMMHHGNSNDSSRHQASPNHAGGVYTSSSSSSDEAIVQTTPIHNRTFRSSLTTISAASPPSTNPKSTSLHSSSLNSTNVDSIHTNITKSTITPNESYETPPKKKKSFVEQDDSDELPSTSHKTLSSRVRSVTAASHGARPEQQQMPPSSPLLPSTKTPTTKPPKGISPAGTIPTPSFKSSNAPTPSCALPTKTTPLRNNNHCSDTSPFTPSSTNTTTSLHQTPSCSYQHSPTSSHPTSKSFPFHTPPLSNQISPHARLYLSSPRDPMIKSTPPSSSLDSSLNQQQPCQTENGDQPHSCKIGPMHQATLPTLCPKPKQFPITYSQRIGQCVWTPLELMVPSVAETCSRNVICDTLEKLEAFEKFCLKIVKNPDDYRQDKALEILHTFNLDIHQAKRFIKEHPMQITTQPLLTSEQSLKVFNALSQFHLYNGCLRELHRQVIPEVPYSTLVCHFFLNKKNKSAIPKSLTRIINHGRRLMQQQKLSTATTNSDESSEDDEDDETYHDGSQLSQPSQNSTLHTISAHTTRVNEALNRHHAIHSKSNNNNEDEPSSGDERVPESSDNEESNSSGEEENHNDAIKYQPLLHPTHCHTNHFLHNNNHHFGTTTVTNHQDVNYLLSSDSEEADMFSNEGETYIGQKAAEIHSGGSSSSAEEAMYIAIENEDSSSTTEVFNFEHNQMFEFHPPTFE